MAGITDPPLRKLCRRFGAGLTIPEMLDCNPQLRHRRGTYRRLVFADNESPRCIQISGNNAVDMADMAKFCVANKAEIIDINMGCPASKICKKHAGAAWLKNANAVAKMLEQVVNAVEVPVTVKIRTGWDQQHKNALQIAKIAELSGIQAITIHGRTKADSYAIPAEYATAKAIKQSVKIPVIVNGDIDTYKKLQAVIKETQADGFMIGRAALGRPWIFAELSGKTITVNLPELITEHLQMLHEFYGEKIGVLHARKHVGWYLQHNQQAKILCQKFNALQTSAQQLEFVTEISKKAQRDPEESMGCESSADLRKT